MKQEWNETGDYMAAAEVFASDLEKTLNEIHLKYEGDLRFAFKVEYDGTLDELKEKLSKEGYGSDKVFVGPHFYLSFDV